jgi:hypothetical protein
MSRSHCQDLYHFFLNVSCIPALFVHILYFAGFVQLLVLWIHMIKRLM